MILYSFLVQFGLESTPPADLLQHFWKLPVTKRIILRAVFLYNASFYSNSGEKKNLWCLCLCFYVSGKFNFSILHWSLGCSILIVFPLLWWVSCTVGGLHPWWQTFCDFVGNYVASFSYFLLNTLVEKAPSIWKKLTHGGRWGGCNLFLFFFPELLK